jgi:ribosomal protein L12E/L44/L45/RPP1/RPP2
VDQPQTFRSPTALVVWVVWLLFAAGNWIDLAVQGRDHASVVAAAVLLLATGAAYVTAQRPRVIVDDAGMTIKNPVRDHRISWAAVTDVDLMDLLRVHCAAGQGAAGQGAAGQGAAGQGRGERRKTISAWAVHYSRRRQYSADVKARRAARTAGGRPSLFGGLPAASRSLSCGTPAAARDTSDEATAKILVRLIDERATAARAEALWTASPPTPALAPAPASTATDAPATDSARLLTSAWSTTAIAALVIPALILLIVCLF